jgi:cell division septation protein DedD
MESPLKQRLIGAAVLAALAIIFLPMLLKGPEVKEPDAAQVPLSMPAAPGQQFETRELPLDAPESATPAGGVLGVPAAAPPSNNAPAAAPESSIAPPAASPTAATPTPAVAAPAQVPAATKPPAMPEPATVAAGNYAVNIGSFSKIDNANALVAKLRAAKLPVIADHVMLGQVDALRVRVGPYADRTAAEAGRLRADEIAGGTSKVIVLDAVGDSAPTPKPAPTPTAKPSVAPATTKPTAPVPAATPKPAAAPVASGFAVQLAAPASEADANALRDRAHAAGFAAFVQRVETDAGVRFRVRVGPVADRIAAEQLRDSVNAKLGSKGIIVPHP